MLTEMELEALRNTDSVERWAEVMGYQEHMAENLLKSHFPSLSIELQARWGDALWGPLKAKERLPDWEIFRRYTVLKQHGYKAKPSLEGVGLKTEKALYSFRKKNDERARELGFNPPKRRRGRPKARRDEEPQVVPLAATLPYSSPLLDQLDNELAVEQHMQLATLGMEYLAGIVERSQEQITRILGQQR